MDNSSATGPPVFVASPSFNRELIYSGTPIAAAVQPSQTQSDMDHSVTSENVPRLVGIWDLPRGPFIALALALLSNSFSITMLYPFAYFMCRDFHLTPVDQELGYYSGILASAFFLGRFVSSFVLGKLSDVYGRKVILRVGLVSTVVFSVMFGCSQNYTMAILARFLSGLFNGINCFTGIIGVSKVIASELVSHPAEQAVAMSVIGAVWGAGMIVGPGISGLLSQPAEKFPSVFPPGSLFARLPYLLPCLVSAVFSGAALLAEYRYLPETLVNRTTTAIVAPRPDANPEYVELELTLTPLTPTPSVHDDGDDDYLAELRTTDVHGHGHDAVELDQELEILSQMVDSGRAVSDDRGTSLGVDALRRVSEPFSSRGRKPRNQHGEYVALGHETEGESVQSISTASSISSVHVRPNHMRPTAAINPVISLNSPQAAIGPTVNVSESTSTAKSRWLCADRGVATAVTIYSLWSMASTMFDEVFPLWAIAGLGDGGLGFDSGRIGVSMSITGLLVLLFQLLLYPWLEKQFGPLHTFRYFSALAMPIFLGFPYITYLSNGGNTSSLMWFMLILASVLKNTFSLSVFTSSFLLINNSAPSQQRGAVNGLAMSVASLFKAVGPSISGALFSWSLTNGLGFPLDFRFVFEMVATLASLCCLTTWLLPATLDRPTTRAVE